MINFTELSTYVDEQKLPLIRKVVFAPKSSKYFNWVTGIKGVTALNLLNTDVDLLDGTVCGWNADGGESALSQRNISPAHISVQMAFCDKAMQKYWTSYEVKVAASEKDGALPFEEDFVNGVIENVGEKIEKLIWQGDTASGDANLAKTDGLVKIINNAAGVIKQTADASSSILDRTYQVYNAIPDNALAKSSIYMSLANFRALVQELTKANYFNYAPKVDDEMTIILPGTNTSIHGVAGLSGVNSIISLVDEHTFYGVDMEGDEEKFDLWYSKDNQEYRLAINFVVGVQIAFPNEVVINTKA